MSIWTETTQDARKARWEMFWAMEDLPRPIWLVPNSPTLVQGITLLTQGKSIHTLLTSKEEQYESSIAYVKNMEEAQKYFAFDDAVNHLQPYQGVPIFASAFGCDIEYFDYQLPASRPRYSGDEAPKNILQQQRPPLDAGMLGEILEMTTYFEQKSGGAYPMAVTDLQSPMDTAYLVWNSCDFMVAMYTDKDAVHHLMRLCTDLFIGFVKEMRSRVSQFIPAHFPPVYLPDGQGAALSEDTLAVLSSDFFEEFTLPYLQEVSEEFGGLFVHSCGNIEHQLPSIKKIRNLKGLNFSVSATRFEAVWEQLKETCCIIPHCSQENIVRSFKSAEEWITHVMAASNRNRGLGLVVYPDTTTTKTSEASEDHASPAAGTEPEPFPQFMTRISELIHTAGSERGRYA
jgi:hypothetical protein